MLTSVIFLFTQSKPQKVTHDSGKIPDWVRKVNLTGEKHTHIFNISFT